MWVQRLSLSGTGEMTRMRLVIRIVRAIPCLGCHDMSAVRNLMAESKGTAGLHRGVLIEHTRWGGAQR